MKRPDNPLVMAESIAEKLNLVPWPLTAFLSFNTNSERFFVHVVRANDPEAERMRHQGLLEVGTYNGKATAENIAGDILDGMARFR